jgi:hypothetical protein
MAQRHSQAPHPARSRLRARRRSRAAARPHWGVAARARTVVPPGSHAGRARPRRDRRCRSAASRPSAGPRRWSVPALLSLFGTHEGHLCQEGVRVWPGDRVRSRAGYRSGSSSQLPGVTPARGGGSWGRRVLFVLACEGRVSPECAGRSGLTSRTRSRSGPLSGPFLLATLAIGCPAPPRWPTAPGANIEALGVERGHRTW